MSYYNEVTKPNSERIFNCTTAALAVNPSDHEGKIILLGAATITATLPTATGSGAKYTFFTSFTASAQKIQVTTTDTFGGGVSMSTDIGGVTMLCAATSDTLTMNGTDQGGVIGSHVTFRDVAAGKWMVSGFLATTSTEADPWTAAVS